MLGSATLHPTYTLNRGHGPLRQITSTFRLAGFQHHKRHNKIPLVADRNMMPADAQLRQMLSQCLVKLQHRLTEAVMRDADAIQANRMAQTAADGFGKGFLGGKALRQQPRRMGVALEFRHFALAQYPPGKTSAVMRKHLLDARILDYIGAYSVDHIPSNSR